MRCGALLRLDPSTSLRAGSRGARALMSLRFCVSLRHQAKTSFVGRAGRCAFLIDKAKLIDPCGRRGFGLVRAFLVRDAVRVPESR